MAYHVWNAVVDGFSRLLSPVAYVFTQIPYGDDVEASASDELNLGNISDEFWEL